MIAGIRVAESLLVPIGQAVRDNTTSGYPRVWVNPFNRYGERAGVYDLGKKTLMFTRYNLGVAEAARDRRRRG